MYNGSLVGVTLLTILACQAADNNSRNRNGKNEEPLIVETTTGKVEGIRRTAVNGEKVDMWWGIPYAEPPVEDLRFRAPRPIKK